jgi:hypothetical protein
MRLAQTGGGAANPERTIELFVDEVIWPICLGYSRCHMERDPEMSGTPGDILSQFEQPFGHPSNRLLSGLSHRLRVDRDVS